MISPDPSASRQLYVDALGLPLAREPDGYLHSENIEGSKSFGIWPLSQAAQVCFGITEWPADRPIPQASIEFEVADADAIATAADERVSAAAWLLHGSKCMARSPNRGDRR